MGSRIEYGVGAREAEVIICAIGRADLTVARINPSRGSQSLPSLFPILHYYRSFTLEASVPDCFGMGCVNFLQRSICFAKRQPGNLLFKSQYDFFRIFTWRFIVLRRVGAQPVSKIRALVELISFCGHGCVVMNGLKGVSASIQAGDFSCSVTLLPHSTSWPLHYFR